MRHLFPRPSTDLTTRLRLVSLVLVGAACVAGCRTRLAAPTTQPATLSPVVVRGGAYVRDVQLLRSSDFVERSRAAERLVAGGEAAVPALGAAGDGTVRAVGSANVGTTAPVLRTILADLEGDVLLRQLDSSWPVVRRETAAELGRRGRWHAVPYLLPRLEDDDDQVRAASASALRRLTNRFFGYDARACLSARRQATGRWREWWSVEGRVGAARDGRDGAG